VTFCPDLLRSTFAAEKLLLLCRILPRPVIPEMVVPIKSPVPFLQKPISDKIPDYYEHIRQSKQEKLFHEAIFQIGNLTDCGCGSPGGERAAAALKEFAESFQERNPHLRVFNMVLHMDEATPHLHCCCAGYFPGPSFPKWLCL